MSSANLDFMNIVFTELELEFNFDLTFDLEGIWQPCESRLDLPWTKLHPPIEASQWAQSIFRRFDVEKSLKNVEYFDARRKSVQIFDVEIARWGGTYRLDRQIHTVIAVRRRILRRDYIIR